MEKQRWKESMERRAKERRSEKRKSEKKEDAGARKGRKVAKHCVSQWFVAPEGRKLGSLQRRVRSQLARWAIKSCEAHFQSQNVQNTPGSEHIEKVRSCDVEKVHAVVARSTFRGQNVQTTPFSDHFWKLRCRKSARRCGAKHISKSKCTKDTRPGALLALEMSKKCTPLWREALFQVKMLKTRHVRTTFWRSDVVSRGRRKGLCTLPKVRKTWGFCGISKSDGRRGAFEEDLQRCMLRGRRSTRDMSIRAVRRSERWFPEMGCILEHQICKFAKMILRDRCSTSHDLASLFPGRRSTLDRWSAKIAKRIGTKPSALHSTFHFWRKSRRIASFLIVNFKNWGGLAELHRFLTLPSSKIEEVSQNCFVLDVVKFETGRSLAEQLRFQSCR